MRYTVPGSWLSLPGQAYLLHSPSLLPTPSLPKDEVNQLSTPQLQTLIQPNSTSSRNFLNRSVFPLCLGMPGGKEITVFPWRAGTFSLHLPQYHLGLRQITCMIPEDNSEDTRSSDSSSGNFPLGTQLVCFFQDIQNLKTRNPSAGASGTVDLQWDNNRHQKGFGELPRSSRNSEPSSPGYRFINCPLPSNSLLPYNFPSTLSSFCVKLSPYLSSNQTSFAV